MNQGCSSSTRPHYTTKRTWVWGNRPHCSRISWGMVTCPLLVIRMVRPSTPLRILPALTSLAPAQGTSMSMYSRPDPSCGKLFGHYQPRATIRQANLREAAAAALHCGTPGRGGVAAGTSALWQPGPAQPGAQATAGRGQACTHRPGGLRQGVARPDFWHSNGTPTLGGAGSRNLRAAGDPLATGGSAAPLQRAAHHPGALAHYVRHRQAPNQPPPADRQASGGV